MRRIPSGGTKKLALQTFEKEKVKKKNSLLWLFEPLENDPGFFQRRLFSFDAAYLDGRLYIAVKDGKPPWEGLLACTSREHHAALLSEFPQLRPHTVLGKWLYISQSHREFESVAVEIVSLALKRDRRLGVDPGARRRRSSPIKDL
jgi:hypothetical protein